MGVRDKDAREIRAKSALSRTSDGSLTEIGEYSVTNSGQWEYVTVPKLVADNCDVGSDDTVTTYCDFDNGFLVIDLGGDSDE